MNDQTIKNQGSLKQEWEFFTFNGRFREYLLLSIIEKNPHASQHRIAGEIDVSSSMANIYIRRLVDEELIKVSGKTNRTMEYTLTTRGLDRRGKLMCDYFKEITLLYSMAKREVERRIRELYAQGLRTVVLFGAAETGELVCSAAKLTPLRILGLVDNDVSKHGLFLGDIPVSPPDTIESFRPDGVLIASSGGTEEIRQQLHDLTEKGIAVVTL